MRLFGARRGAVPADVLERAALPPGERPLAVARATDGTWVVGTRAALVLVDEAPGTGTRRIPWQQIEHADWDRDESRVRVSEVGTYGEPRPSYTFEVDDPGALLELVRERVTASVVLQRRVLVAGKRGFTTIGRRPPMGGEINWMHEYDAGVDPDDPEVRLLADEALRVARTEVGEGGEETAPSSI